MVYTEQKNPKVMSGPRGKECHDKLVITEMNVGRTAVAYMPRIYIPNLTQLVIQSEKKKSVLVIQVVARC